MPSKMTKAEELLSKVTGGVICFLEMINEGVSDHDEKFQESRKFLNTSLGESVAYLESKYPSTKRGGQ